MHAIHKSDNRERHLQCTGDHFKWVWHHVIPRCTKEVTTHLCDIQLPQTMWFPCHLTSNDRYVRAGLSWSLQHTQRLAPRISTVAPAFNCLWVKARVRVNMSHIFACRLYCPNPLFPTQGSIKLLSGERQRDWLVAGIYWALMAQVLRKTSIKLCFYIWFIAQLFLLS